MQNYFKQQFWPFSNYIGNMPGIKVGLLSSTILNLWMFIVLLTTVPFIVFDLIFYYDIVADKQLGTQIDLIGKNYDSIWFNCLVVFESNTLLSFQTWLKVDGYSKVAIAGFVVIMNFLSCITRKSSYFVEITGFVMFLFYLYQFAWLILGVYMYRQIIEPDFTNINCTDRQRTYLISLLAIDMPLTVIKIVLSWLRSRFSEYSDENKKSTNFEPQPRTTERAFEER